MNRFAVGEVMPDWSGPQPEGAHFTVTSSGVTLLHLYDGPTAREIRGARQGKARFGLLPAGPHTLFLLYDIDGLTKGWSDAPFALGLVPPERQAAEPRQPEQGHLLTSILAEAGTGVVHALRAVSLTPAFSAALDDLVEAQRAALPAFTRAGHAAAMQAAYRRWPRCEDMLGSAVAIERGGLPFGGAG